MTDKPRIVFGETPSIDRIPTLPAPTAEKQHILTHNLGLPENLAGMQVLELFSGDVESSFKPEVLSRNKSVASNYIGVDIAESTGLGHRQGDVYDLVKELPANSFDFVIMNHPPVWYAIADEKKWRRQNANRLTTPSLADPEQFMKFLADCTRLVAPKKGNKISIASGFPQQDVEEIWRRAATTIPRYSNWHIHTPPTGNYAQLILVKRRGGVADNLKFPEHSLQLIHI